MLATPTTQGKQISYADNFEEGRWIIIYIYNKIRNTQETLLAFIFIISGGTTFTTSSQVSSSIYTSFFGIKQYPSGNMYQLTKLKPLSPGCNKVPLSSNTTGTCTPTAYPIEVFKLKILIHCNFFQGREVHCSQ